jgi:hypothetical protein
MAWDHALKMQTSNNIYLFILAFKYAIHIVELEAIKQAWEGISFSVGNTTLQKQDIRIRS